MPALPAHLARREGDHRPALRVQALRAQADCFKDAVNVAAALAGAFLAEAMKLTEGFVFFPAARPVNSVGVRTTGRWRPRDAKVLGPPCAYGPAE